MSEKKTRKKKVRKTKVKTKATKANFGQIKKLLPAAGVCLLVITFVVYKSSKKKEEITAAKYNKKVVHKEVEISEEKKKLADKYEQADSGVTSKDITKAVNDLFMDSPEWKNGQEKLAEVGYKLNPLTKVGTDVFRLKITKAKETPKRFESKELNIHLDKPRYKQMIRKLNKGNLPKVSKEEALYILEWRRKVKNNFKSFR